VDHKSEILLNLIHAFIDQVETGEAYPESLASSGEEIEYLGFSLIVGINADGSFTHNAYGYEENDINYIMVTNSEELQPFVEEFAATLDPQGSSLACLIQIPEELDGTTADFLYGRDADVWMETDIRLAPFANPVYVQEKDMQWNADVYRKLHGQARPEGLPLKQVTTSFFDPEITIQGAINPEIGRYMPEFEHLPDTLEARDSRYITLDYENFPELSPDATEDENNYLFAASAGTAFKEEYSFISGEEAMHHVVTEETKKRAGLLGIFSGGKHVKHDEDGDFLSGSTEDVIDAYAEKIQQSRTFAGLLEDSDELADLEDADKEKPVVEEPVLSPGLIVSSSRPAPVIKEPLKPARVAHFVAKDDILPTMIRESQKELKDKGIPATGATIVIYLQPPVVTSYGFWYKDGRAHFIEGHWMPESYDIDDAIDAFLRDTIPDPKDPWDVCVIRMKYDTEEATTEFLKGKPAYPWMEETSSRSKTLTEAGRFENTSDFVSSASSQEPKLKSLHGTGVSEEVPTSEYF
jgi:hypothetical protein